MVGNAKVTEAAEILRDGAAASVAALDGTVAQAGFVVQHHADAIEKLADTIVETRETVGRWLVWVGTGIAIACAFSIIAEAWGNDGD